MNCKNLKKIFLAMLLICGLYSVSRISLPQLLRTTNAANSEAKSNIEALSSHFSMPSNLKGKELPFHQVYESRQIGFPEDIKNSKRSNATKLILLWTPWNGVQKTINYYTLQPGNASFVDYSCPNPMCTVTYDRKYLQKADAVLFHFLDIKLSDLPRSRTAEQLWILYNTEAPWRIKVNVRPEELTRMKNLFNWTMTYRSDADVVTRYGFITPSENPTSPEFQQKTKNVVWFVSDCNTPSKREDYAKELSKHIDVDVYGKCGDKKCYPSQSSECYEKVLDKYKFYLSFENSLCKDYVTEKFFNIFNYDIIPVVFGAANYSSVAAEGTFVDATQYPDPERLARDLLKISSDSSAYGQMLLKKRSFKAYLDPWTCRLCDALHKDVKYDVLRDVERWWIKEARCKTWEKSKSEFVNSVF